MDLEKALSSYLLTGVSRMVEKSVNYQKVCQMRNGTLYLKEFPWSSYMTIFKSECFGEVGIIFKSSIYIYINLALKGHSIFSSKGKKKKKKVRKKKVFLDLVSFNHLFFQLLMKFLMFLMVV